MPKRTFWLVIGAATGAGTSLWAERRLRRSVQQAAERLQPNALVADVGRTARQAAESTGERVREAFSTGRHEMRRREEELWADLAANGVQRDALPHLSGEPVPDPFEEWRPPPAAVSRNPFLARRARTTRP